MVHPRAGGEHHTPMTAIEAAAIEDLLERADDAAALASRLYGKGRR